MLLVGEYSRYVQLSSLELCGNVRQRNLKRNGHQPSGMLITTQFFKEAKAIACRRCMLLPLPRSPTITFRSV